MAITMTNRTVIHSSHSRQSLIGAFNGLNNNSDIAEMTDIDGVGGPFVSNVDGRVGKGTTPSDC